MKKSNEQKAKEIAEYLNQPNGSNSLLECHQAAMAMAQISQIMANDERFGGVVTDEEWKDDGIIKYIIYRRNCIVRTDYCYYNYYFLAFHTKEQRDLFLKENGDLVKDYLMIE